jgi:hypothetical protein
VVHLERALGMGNRASRPWPLPAGPVLLPPPVLVVLLLVAVEGDELLDGVPKTKDEEREAEACFLLLTVGAVETDLAVRIRMSTGIATTEVVAIRARRARPRYWERILCILPGFEYGTVERAALCSR